MKLCRLPRKKLYNSIEEKQTENRDKREVNFRLSQISSMKLMRLLSFGRSKIAIEFVYI